MPLGNLIRDVGGMRRCQRDVMGMFGGHDSQISYDVLRVPPKGHRRHGFVMDRDEGIPPTLGVGRFTFDSASPQEGLKETRPDIIRAGSDVTSCLAGQLPIAAT